MLFILLCFVFANISDSMQLLFALSDAMAWTSMHNGFDYKAFYHFIIDFFETPSGPTAKNRVRELLKWWTQ